MAMTINEPREQGLPAQIDQLCLLALVLQHLIFHTDSQYLSVGDRHCFSGWMLVVDRDDIATVVDHVGFLSSDKTRGREQQDSRQPSTDRPHRGTFHA